VSSRQDGVRRVARRTPSLFYSGHFSSVHCHTWICAHIRFHFWSHGGTHARPGRQRVRFQATPCRRDANRTMATKQTRKWTEATRANCSHRRRSFIPCMRSRYVISSQPNVPCQSKWMIPSPRRTGDEEMTKSETGAPEAELQPADEKLAAPI